MIALLNDMLCLVETLCNVKKLIGSMLRLLSLIFALHLIIFMNLFTIVFLRDRFKLKKLWQKPGTFK